MTLMAIPARASLAHWLAPPWRRPPRLSRRERALEALVESLAERIAQTEIALLREARDRERLARRAEAAEQDVQRLQGTLDRLRHSLPAPRPGS